MIGETISHYKILEKLGEGGMGVVYKAEDTKLKRTVALKFLPPELVRDPEVKKRFVNEAQTASGLQHHNICTIHEIDETPDGKLFICMDCYEGETLKQKIAGGPLDLVEAMGLSMQVAEGLARAHQAGMVHRDIKPANVMVTNDGVVKIVDFGLAKLSHQTKLTRTGSTVGTPAYMAPEQAMGGEVDHRADIWSLGVVLYELVTGRLPFGGEHIQAMLYSILNEDPEPVTSLRTGVPMELERLIARCLEKNAEDRYQTADDLVSDLRRIKRAIAEPGARSRSVSVSSEVSPRGRRWPWMATAVVMAVLALIALRPYLFPSDKSPGGRTAEGRKMLAVLPMENLGSPEEEHFADGLTEEITSRLAVVSGLGVISRTSAIQYKGTTKNIRQIGDELGVDYILEGTVRWDRDSGSESRVRITQQLINVSDDTHLWADTYEAVMDNIFAVQADIAEQVVEQLDVALLEPERRALEARPTRNFDAYEAYITGLYYSGRAHESAEAASLAIQMFERAVELDPSFSTAYAHLSMAYSLSYHSGHDRTDECLSKSRSAADRALDLAPKLPEAHLALGYYHYRGYREYDLALEAMAVAQESNPGDAGILEATGYIRRRKGDFEGALENFLTGFELNPRSPHLARAIASTYFFMRRYEDADEYMERSINLDTDQLFGYLGRAANYWYWQGDLKKSGAVLADMPQKSSQLAIQALFLQDVLEKNYTGALYKLSSSPVKIFQGGDDYIPKPLYEGLVYGLMGKPDLARASYDSARVVLERRLADVPDDFRIHGPLGTAYAGLGRKQEAIREGELAVELYPVSKDALGGPPRVMDLAHIYIMVGELDAAMDNIEYLVSIPNGTLSVPYLRLDPQLDPLRSHPRFKALLEEPPATGP